jgi:hypothetical protein
MTDIELVPIEELDRRNPTERRLDDLLNRYAKLGFRTFDVVASYADLLQTYLAVARRRNKIRRGKKNGYVAEVERGYLSLITQDTQDQLIRRIQIAKEHFLMGAQGEGIKELNDLERDIPILASSDQTKISSTKRKPNVMKRLLGGICKRKPSITSAGVVEALRDLKGQGVVLAIDDEYVEIDVAPLGSTVTETKRYRLRAIPTLLSRVKNPKK